MADDRAVSRREGECGGGSAGESWCVLFRGEWRRRLENDGRRHGVETNLRQGTRRFDWRDDAGAFESKHHLCGNGAQYNFWRQQLWRWSLQVGGRRRKLAARRTGGLATYR